METKILIIEDDPAMSEILDLFLKELGYQCYYASSVEEAFQFLNSVNLVVIDSFNDKEFEIAKLCKSKNIFCIYHTGKVDVTDEEYYCFDRVVFKPGLEYLVKCINEFDKTNNKEIENG